MRDTLQTVSGVVSVVLDGFASPLYPAQIEDFDRPKFVWIEQHIRTVGGQKYLYRTVAYQNTRTKRVRLRSECFKHITE